MKNRFIRFLCSHDYDHVDQYGVPINKDDHSVSICQHYWKCKKCGIVGRVFGTSMCHLKHLPTEDYPVALK